MLPSITLAYFVSFTTPMTNLPGSSYNVGQTVTLEWTSDIPGNYGSIILYQNGTTIQTINSNYYFYYGTQSYSWTIPSSVPIGSDYQIKLIVPYVGGFYSSTFSINSAGSGISGHSLSFDGVDDYVGIGSSSNFDVVDELTISAWIKPNEITYAAIIDRLPYSGSNGYRLVTRIDGRIWAQFGTAESSDYAQTGTNYYSIGQWINIVGVFKNSNYVKLYINGSLIESVSTTRSFTTDKSLEFGRWYNTVGDNEYFKGNIDEGVIWNEAITAAEIAALYNSGNPLTAASDSGNYTSAANVKGYWRFGENTGTKVHDLSGSGNHGTISGASYVSPGADAAGPIVSSVSSTTADGTYNIGDTLAMI
jgi:hypothetical protein